MVSRFIISQEEAVASINLYFISLSHHLLSPGSYRDWWYSGQQTRFTFAGKSLLPCFVPKFIC